MVIGGFDCSILYWKYKVCVYFLITFFYDMNIHALKSSLKWVFLFLKLLHSKKQIWSNKSSPKDLLFIFIFLLIASQC